MTVAGGEFLICKYVARCCITLRIGLPEMEQGRWSGAGVHIPTATDFPAVRCSLATLMHLGRCSR